MNLTCSGLDGISFHPFKSRLRPNWHCMGGGLGGWEKEEALTLSSR